MNRETTLGVLAMVVIAVIWIVSPGATILLIGGTIGGLTLLAWIARRLGI